MCRAPQTQTQIPFDFGFPIFSLKARHALQSLSMVQQLEVALFLPAPSFEVYADNSTLKDNVKLLAIEIAKKTYPLDLPLDHPPPDTILSMTTQEDTNNMSVKDLDNEQNRLFLLHHAFQCPYADGKCPQSKHCTDYKYHWHHLSHCTDSVCGWPHIVYRVKQCCPIFVHAEKIDCDLCRRQKILGGE